MDFEQIIWGKRKFSDILKDIDSRSREKEKEIKKLIATLSPLIEGPQAALIIVPLIADYLSVSVKNDEQLVKLAAIVQKAISNSSDGGSDYGMTEAEKQQLMDSVKEVAKSVEEPVIAPTCIEENKEK